MAEKRNTRVKAEQAVQRAREILGSFGLEVEGVIGIKWVREEGQWAVTVTVIETKRVPSTDDILAAYVVAIDRTGELVDYQQLRRFPRSQVSKE